VIGKLQKELNKWEEDYHMYRTWGKRTEDIEEHIQDLNHKIEAVKNRVEEALKKCECPICMDDCDKNSMTITKCCSNTFCRSCMGDLFRGKIKVPCPLCRNEISMKELYIFDENGNAADVQELAEGGRKNPEAVNIPTSFQQILEKLLAERPNGKILIFAPYQGTSESIKVYLKDSRVKYTELTGCMAPAVTKRLKQFEEGVFRVLFLNSKISNSGFNLQCATDIIIISGEQFNLEHPTVKQIVSRVARFPRTEEVPVHVIRPMNIIE
jgi:SNF2 family DNA or RNA helicase